jgi:hypothetical protein
MPVLPATTKDKRFNNGNFKLFNTSQGKSLMKYYIGYNYNNYNNDTDTIIYALIISNIFSIYDGYQRKHPDGLTQYVKLKKSQPVTKRLHEASNDRSQPPITAFSKGPERTIVSATEKLILQFIVQGIHPLRTVEQPEFQALISGKEVEYLNMSMVIADVNMLVYLRFIYLRFKAW